MKFSEIPHFTRSCNYTVNYIWDGFVEDFLPRMEQYGLELCPDFQRGHVWTEEQQIKYIEFMMKGGSTGREIFFNHPGWQNSYKGKMVCVDGLQRITAVQRFINNEIKAFGTYFCDFEGSIYQADGCSFTVSIHSLKTRKEVLKWYIELNEGGVIHSKEEIERVKKLLEIEEKQL